MNNKITFPELVELVAQKANTSKRMSEVFLKEFFATISSAMIEGESVKVKGLGTFKVTAVKQRSTRSVNDGGVITIPDHNKITFVPDSAMARTINMPFEHFEVVTLSDEITDEQIDEIDKSVKTVAPETVEPQDEPQDELQEEPVPEADEPQVPPIPQNEPEEETEESSQDESAPEVVPPAFVVTPPPFEAAPQEPPVVPEPPVAPVVAPPAPQPPTIPVAPPVPEPKAPEMPVPAPAPQKEEPVEEEPVAETPVADAAASRRSWWRGFAVGALSMLLLAALVGMLTHCGGSTDGDNHPEVIATDSVAGDSASVAQSAAEPAVPVVTDTVTDKKEDWPVNIAKRHYGHEVFWVYIYLENKDKLDDYMRVPSGTVLVIPPAEKYGINASDPASVKKAQEEANRAYLETQK